MEYFNNLPLYQMSIKDEEDGLTKISLVEQPAVDVNFIAFDKEDKQDYKFIDEEKRLITGVSLRADYPIYRLEPSPCYVVFSANIIKNMVEKYFSEKKINNTSINHTTDIDGLTMIESYFIDKQRGVCPKEFSKVTDGSWITTFKCNNSDIWADVKSGKIKGFSVEALLEYKTQKPILSLDDLIDELIKK